MGYRGSIRRAVDTHLVHANVDTDVLVSEEPPLGCACLSLLPSFSVSYSFTLSTSLTHAAATRKPEELYLMIEHFCLGRRRLELFGSDHNIRRGWLTLGLGISTSNYAAALYQSYFEQMWPDGVPSYLLGSTPGPS
jgi:hypothetical protein